MTIDERRKLNQRTNHHNTMQQANEMLNGPTIKAIIVLDGEGKRIAAKYYTQELSDSKKQFAFEQQLHKKTNRSNARSEGLSVLI